MIAALRLLRLGVAALLAGCASLPPATELVAVMRSRPVVLLGEVHDHVAQHRWRAEALRQWLAQGARPALLMEQFDRERQGAIDRARSVPGVDADAIVAAAGGAGWNWVLYKPYVALALAYDLPLVATNVSRADTRRIVGEGLAAHGFSADLPADVEALQVQEIVDGHCGTLDLAQARRLVPAQVARDQVMARLVEQHAPRGVVLLAGNGHVRTDAGVPRWLSAATRANSVAIGTVEQGRTGHGRFDAVFTTPAQPRQDPCAALRQR